MDRLLKIKGILNKKNGQITMSPSKKSLKKINNKYEEEIKKGRKMLWRWEGFE